jgi:Xaa-Pro aminopeptidase
MKYEAFPKELFIQNRERLKAKLKPNSLAIFNSHDEMPKSADSQFYFAQNRDLFWVSGIDQEDSIVMMYPDCPNPNYRELLFLKKTSDTIAIWEGHKYTKEEARATSGIQKIHWLEDFNIILQLVMHQAEFVYLNLNEHDRHMWTQSYKDLDFAHKIRKEFPLHKMERLAPIMHQLRAIKSQPEIDVMQKACDITGKAFERVLKFTRPGVWEYEIEAEITHEFLRNRATGHAYTPIIASGPSACVLHYIENNKECKDGDLMLLDFGAEYGNYAADLTRCIPVNGKFSPRQKEIYNAVLNVHKAAKKMLVTGETWDNYHKKVGLAMTDELLRVGLISKEDTKKDDWENESWDANKAYRKYLMHGTSHFLGLDVHDVGNRYKPFAPGMVFTCEPGIYIPAEGIGVRIENDILITENGNTDLMGNIPLEVDEIEALMAR